MKRQAPDDAGERRDHERAPDVKRRRHDERGSASSSVRLLSEAKEEDPHRLAQRQKQLDYGKNTVGYDRYCAAVPRHQRRRGVHPMTPDKTLNVSKKAFDGMVRKWRQALHTYDPPELQAAAADAHAATVAAPASPPAAAVATLGPTIEATRSTHDDDVADLDPGAAAPALSIYDNFDDNDANDNDDNDDDDLL